MIQIDEWKQGREAIGDNSDACLAIIDIDRFKPRPYRNSLTSTECCRNGVVSGATVSSVMMLSINPPLGRLR